MFNICVIGCGEHSAKVHGPSLMKYKNENDNVSLCACADINFSTAQNYKNIFGFDKVYTNFIEMLDKEDVSAVLVVVPFSLTFEITTEIMKRKIPIILEKPPGANLSEVKLLAQMQEELFAPHYVAFNRRTMPQITYIKEAIKNQVPNYIHYEMYRVNRLEPFASTAIHAVDVVSFLADSEYDNVRLTYQKINDTSSYNIYIDAKMKNNCNVRIDILPVSGAIFENVTLCTNSTTFFASLPTGEDSVSTLFSKVTSTSNGIKEELLLQATEKSEFYDIGGFYHEDKLFFDELQYGNSVNLYEGFSKSIQAMEIMECITDLKTEYRRT